jgi:replicative DNA helicase
VLLSAPIPYLKNRARKLQRAEGIPLAQALDRIAMSEGYGSWSLLVAKASSCIPSELFDGLAAGDLLLIGARPGQGKTVASLKIVLSALRQGRSAWFFSLLNDPPDIHSMFRGLGAPAALPASFTWEHSDELCAERVIERMRGAASERSVAVIDHVQLLDQRRRSPPLHEQMGALRAFAKQSGCVLVFISQIRSSFDQTGRRLPGLEDVRLPNLLDLGVFDKLLFQHGGRSRLHQRAR